MAIPLPNPNIDDTKKVDNLTWSSNKIARSIEAVESEIPTMENIAAIADTEIESYLSYGATEKKIGKFGNDDLYKITISETIHELAINNYQVLTNISALNIDKLINIECICHLKMENGYSISDANVSTIIYDSGDVNVKQSVRSVVTDIDFEFYITLYYTKATI